MTPNARKLLSDVLSHCEVVLEDGGCSSNYIGEAADTLDAALQEIDDTDMDQFTIVRALSLIFTCEDWYGIPYSWVRHTLRQVLGFSYAEFVPGSVDAKRRGKK